MNLGADDSAGQGSGAQELITHGNFFKSVLVTRWTLQALPQKAMMQHAEKPEDFICIIA